jgi:hypothetical protein
MQKLMFSTLAAFVLAIATPSNELCAQAQGWVLVIPPKESEVWGSGDPTIKDTPITAWEYISAHDTAQVCEQRAAKFRGENAEAFSVATRTLTEGERSRNPVYLGLYGLLVRSLSTRCVPYELWWGKGK